MSKPLIGMMGVAQAGKDTFAGYLGYRKLAFADALRDLAYQSSTFYRESVDAVGYECAKTTIPGIREYLQDLGVGCREVIGPDVWVDACFRKYDPEVPTVITDVRFPNEVDRIRSMGGVLIRVNRLGHEAPNNHISETWWQTVEPDYEYTFKDGALVHMEWVAKCTRMYLDA